MRLGPRRLATGARERVLRRGQACGEGRGIEGVVWAALPPKFGDVEQMPSAENVVEYLTGLKGEARDNAERYVRRAPRQIATRYRRQIEARLNWTPVEEA